MLRKNGHILLSDFGCAKLLVNEGVLTENNCTKEEEKQQLPEEGRKREKRRCSFVGTAQYVSPEVFLIFKHF